LLGAFFYENIFVPEGQPKELPKMGWGWGGVRVWSHGNGLGICAVVWYLCIRKFDMDPDRTKKRKYGPTLPQK